MNSRDMWYSSENTTKKKREDTKIQILKNSFMGNINYEKIYKDFDESVEYDTWIYDEASTKKDSEEKNIIMYPYQTIRQGEYIHWNGDTWLVRGVDKQYDYLERGMMKKCLHNTLNWIDEYGVHRIPIYSESKVLRDPLLDNNRVFLIDDSMEGYIQKNEETLRLAQNMRFCFGISSVYKSLEIVDFYIDNTIKLLFKKDEKLATDDFDNLIAHNKTYTFNIDTTSPSGGVEGAIGDFETVEASFYYDNIKQDIIIEWESSDENIATVDSSGLVTFISLGTANLSASYNGLNDTKVINCSIQSQENVYVIEPEIEKIEMGETREYEIFNTIGGVNIPLNSLISCSTISDSFIFKVVDSNNYTIENISELDLDISITIEDLDTSEIINRNYRLRMW